MFFLKRECLTIIGTAHVSANSVDEVKNAIYEQHPEIVAIELDKGRYTRLKNEMMGIKEDDTISVSKIIKEEKVGLFLATTILSYFQSKIGEDVDVKPGSEMIGAIEAAQDLEIPIALIDREINTTLQRALNKMGFVEKFKFAFSLLTSIFSDDEEDEIDIEELKNPDNLDELMEFFKDESPKVYEVLVQERDAYLAGNLLRIPQDHVLAVVGAGHKPGINRYLDNPETIPPLSQLEIIDIASELEIRKMNTYIFKLENNIDDANIDESNEETTIYKTENITRNVWIVRIKHNKPENINFSTSLEYNKQMDKKYYIDATTGEIIGGEDFFEKMNNPLYN